MCVPDVLWILNGCGLEAGSVTGGPLRFHEISRRWLQAGAFEQDLMTTAGGEAMLRRMGCTLPMHRVRAAILARRERVRAQRLWSYLLSAAHAPSVARHLAPADAVITVSDYFCDIVPACAAKRRWPGCRWIAWIHHCELPPAERPGNRLVNSLTWHLQEWSFRRIARHADQAWVLDTEAGDRVRGRLLALGMPDGCIRRMRNGISLETIRVVPEPARKTVDAVMIGVRPNKGLYDVIAVWEAVQRRRPGTTLRLMGGISAAVEPVLEEMRRRGLDRWIEVFRPPGGYLAPADYFAKVKEARLLFAPSHEEGWGIALAEALACGLPVVAYDLPVYRRIFGGALLAQPCFDHEAMAAAVCAGLDAPEAERAARVAAGRAAAAGLGWDRCAAEDRETLWALAAGAKGVRQV